MYLLGAFASMFVPATGRTPVSICPTHFGNGMARPTPLLVSVAAQAAGHA
jgi:hypothetical protein